MRKFYVCLTSLRRSGRSKAVKSLELWAKDLTDACEKAKAMYPNMGVTPTEVSMCWLQWPQPKGGPCSTLE